MSTRLSNRSHIQQISADDVFAENNCPHHTFVTECCYFTSSIKRNTQKIMSPRFLKNN